MLFGIIKLMGCVEKLIKNFLCWIHEIWSTKPDDSADDDSYLPENLASDLLDTCEITTVIGVLYYIDID